MAIFSTESNNNNMAWLEGLDRNRQRPETQGAQKFALCTALRPNQKKGHDFANLKKAGIHPLAALAAISAVPAFILWNHCDKSALCKH